MQLLRFRKHRIFLLLRTMVSAGGISPIAAVCTGGTQNPSCIWEEVGTKIVIAGSSSRVRKLFLVPKGVTFSEKPLLQHPGTAKVLKANSTELSKYWPSLNALRWSILTCLCRCTAMMQKYSICLPLRCANEYCLFSGRNWTSNCWRST